MLARDAKAAARAWVTNHAAAQHGFRGAFFHGSINEIPDDAEIPPTSDLDVVVVLAGPIPPTKRGKLVHGGVLLDVTELAEDDLRSADQVLVQYHLAPSFRHPSVIADPTGRLTALQAAVAGGFADRRWVRRRAEQALEKVRTGYRLDAGAPFPDQVFAWLFPAAITTHVLLVAGLRNPTVRRRYVAARDLLTEYGHLDLYDPLLDLLGCARIAPGRVRDHLSALEPAFDDAAATIRSPFPFAADLSALARPIAIDGSRELIVQGNHREAVFWLAVTATRCRQVLLRDAPPDARDRHAAAYRALLADLGIAGFVDLQRRRHQTEAILPRVWSVAEAIMDANPEIVG